MPPLFETFNTSLPLERSVEPAKCFPFSPDYSRPTFRRSVCERCPCSRNAAHWTISLFLDLSQIRGRWREKDEDRYLLKDGDKSNILWPKGCRHYKE